MKALILLSHGSRRKESNEEMQQLARSVAALDGHSFGRVVCAFQQFARPSFHEILDDVVAQGASDIVVFPLFLAAGNHVLVDVPDMIARARARHPAATITVTPHLGQTPDLASFLMAQADRQA